jgi:hypothetical protein
MSRKSPSARVKSWKKSPPPKSMKVPLTPSIVVVPPFQAPRQATLPVLPAAEV